MEILEHDPIRHLKSLRQILCQDKKPIGFFLSAGCPLSVNMPEGKWPLIPDMRRLSEHVEEELGKEESRQEKYNKLLNELVAIKKDKNNLEDVLSFLRTLKEVSHGGEVRGLCEDDLHDLETNICKCIVDKVNVELPRDNSPYHKLARWIGSIDRDKPIEIFTTNYDLLMEQALEDTNLPYFDGFVGSRKSFFHLRSVENNSMPNYWVRLWKIHGSINWFQNEAKEIFRSDKYYPSNTSSSHLIYPSHLKYQQSRKMPFLALSDQLSRFIKQPSAALIMCGYSFNDEHINDTILNALNSNPTAVVIALLFGNMTVKKEAQENQLFEDVYYKGIEIAKNRHNLCLWAFDEAIIGGNRGSWATSDKEVDDELKAYLIEEIHDKERTNIISKNKMGDFKVLANFLSSLIDNRED